MATLHNDDLELKDGYRMRPVEMSDAPAVIALIQDYCRLLDDNDEMTLGELENFWRTPGLSMQDDLRLVLSPQGQVAGYMEALTLNDPPNHPWLWFRLHPEAGAHTGEALINWALPRMKRVLDTLDPELRVSIAGFVSSKDAAGKRLLEAHAFQLVRHAFHMGIELQQEPSAPQWPEGITLRPFDPTQHAEQVYLALEEAFLDHFGFQPEPFETGFPRWKHMMIDDKEAFDPGLWFIAMDGDQVAGFSLCRTRVQAGREIGWVEDLGVRRPWRKRGLGQALLLHSFGEFYRRGLSKAGLGVDASNLTGALKLYERVGMQVDTRYDRYELELRPGKELMTTELNA